MRNQHYIGAFTSSCHEQWTKLPLRFPVREYHERAKVGCQEHKFVFISSGSDVAICVQDYRNGFWKEINAPRSMLKLRVLYQREQIHHKRYKTSEVFICGHSNGSVIGYGRECMLLPVSK